MNTQHDPTTAILLDGVDEPAEREAIIASQATLHADGATSLPGALGILIARLIKIVVNLVTRVSPSSNHEREVTALREDIKQLRQEFLPQFISTKEEMIATNRSTRRLRMTYVLLWILLGTVSGAGAGAYAAYHYFALTPQQKDWLAIGKHMGRSLTQDEVDWLNLGRKMTQHDTGLMLADPVPGTFGVVVAGKQPVLRAKFIQEGGQNMGVETRWQDNGEGQ